VSFSSLIRAALALCLRSVLMSWHVPVRSVLRQYVRPELNPSVFVLMCRISLSPLQLLDFWSLMIAGFCSAATGSETLAGIVFPAQTVG
jgi:hypothetical protein